MMITKSKLLTLNPILTLSIFSYRVSSIVVGWVAVLLLVVPRPAVVLVVLRCPALGAEASQSSRPDSRGQTQVPMLSE